ncbi:hypothetical protein DSCW_23370 [Desulfosarcina widdelii]|uniref:Uncharacterized protein n=1 Tax=Desulfosarcina widdelii TaxID=947919 RepID=A0A5K7Z2Q4_9BACT|nr:ankyrin repeat domain-containing protein [Desulfosarcina widdelii]BBO74920.1 hypothetical protein DSCW_23370 [Desulfosarcina widdelii]
MQRIQWIAIVSLAFIICSCGGLLYNAQTGNIELMEKSLEHGTSIEKKNQAGSTALIIAAYSGQNEAVEYLCKNGANVNAQANNGTTALISAHPQE